MEVLTQNATRRSTRIRVQIPVSVTSLDRMRPFADKCMALIVSAQGCGFQTSQAMLPETPEEGDNNLKLIAIFGMSQHLRLAVARRFKVPVRDSYGMTEIGSGLYVPMDA